jgi:uncharacterized membrane protein (UPF0182 family)
MQRRIVRGLIFAGLAVLLLLVLGRMAVGLYTDILWYRAEGYLSTFWTRIGWGLGVRAAAALFGAALVFLNLWWVARHVGPVRVRRRYGNLEIAERIPRRHVTAVILAVSVLGGWWLAQLQFDDATVMSVATWLRHVPWGAVDPLFGRDVAFYVFTLPVLSAGLGYLILIAVWIVALVALGHVLVGGIHWDENRLSLSAPARRHLAVLLAGLLLLLGLRFLLGRYLLVVDGNGFRAAAIGFTDVEARLPVYWAMAALTVAAAGAVVYGAWKEAIVAPIVGIGALLVGGVLLTWAYPALVQKFQVEPNELSREAPYIRWNIDFTRRAYGLDAMQRQPFPYRRGARPPQERLEPLLTRLPLWDPEPLQRTFNEVQTLFPYYGFPDVDFDRYGPAGQEAQVGIGVREFQPGGLEQESQTWQSLRLNPSYIRGMGVVMAPAHPGGASGTPELWIRNINPVISGPAAPDSLERPSVFFGETMTEYAIVVPGRDSAFTGEPGVDFPEGVQLSSFLRVLAFAWRFGDETLLFSGDVSRDSRMIFRRSLRDRLEEIAPFVLWDRDPLPVIRDGSVVWMVDGYTLSSWFPLSRAVTLGRSRVRYLRNAVKATIDAITGEVRIYAVADDPVLEAYRGVFPRLVQPLDSMPPALRRHLRYPELALLTQVEILQEYHVQRAEAFYAAQDIWERPERQGAPGGITEDYRPVYALMPAPLEDRTGYLTVMPFIAQARQNMTAVLVARNEAGRYGELTLYELPRDQQIPGPGQVQAIIEQDPQLSQQLSLLRQRGSGVDMGHLRVVALDSSVLYVQPLFLSAEENPIPELWRVVVSDGLNVSMDRTLGAALAGLEFPVETPVGAPAPARGAGWPQEALDLLDRAEERLRTGDWGGYGQALDELRSLLDRLSREGVGTPRP